MKSHEHFKRTFENFEVQIDENQLWQKTSHAIPRRHKRRFIIWWLSGIAGIGILVYFLAFHVPSSASHKPPASANGRLSDIHIAPSDTIVTSIKSSGSHLQTEPTTSNHQDIKRPNTPLHSGHPAKTPLTTAASKNPAINEAVKDQMTALPWHDPSSVASDSTHRSGSDPTHIPVAKAINTSSLTSAFLPEKNPDEISASLPIAWETESIPSMIIRSFPYADRSRIVLNPSESIRKKQIKPAFLITALQGYGLTSLTVIPTGVSESPVAEIYQDRLKGMEYSSTSLNGYLSWPSGWSFGLGLQSGNWVSRLQYRWTQTGRSQEDGTSVVIIDEHGQAQYFSGAIGVTTETEYQSTRYSHHRETGIILYASKTIWRLPRFKMEGYVQGQYNLHTSSTGTALNTAQQLFRYTSAQSPFTKTSPWTIEGGLSLQYHIRPEWRIMGRLGYTHTQLQQHIESHTIRFQFRSLMMSLGVGYQL